MKRIKFAVALALCLCSSALMRAQTKTGGGGGGTSVKVNGSQVSNPNFNATTPLPDSGYSVATFKVSGSSVIVEYLTPTIQFDAGPAWNFPFVWTSGVGIVATPGGAGSNQETVAVQASTNTLPGYVYLTNDFGGTASAPITPHELTFVFDGGGSPLSTATAYMSPITTGCTIKNAASGYGVSIVVLGTPTGTSTVTFWDLATGSTALPTVTNTISTSGIAFTTGNALNTTVSDFGAGSATTVTALDKLAAHLVPDGAITYFSVKVHCQ